MNLHPHLHYQQSSPRSNNGADNNLLQFMASVTPGIEHDFTMGV